MKISLKLRVQTCNKFVWSVTGKNDYKIIKICVLGFLWTQMCVQLQQNVTFYCIPSLDQSTLAITTLIRRVAAIFAGVLIIGDCKISELVGYNATVFAVNWRDRAL